MIKKYKYLEWLLARDLQPRTITEYKRYMEHLEEYKQFNQSVVNDFILRYKGNVARAFLKSYKEYLLKFKTSNMNTEQLTRIKLIDVPKLQRGGRRKTPLVISKEEVLRLYRNMPDKEIKLLLLVTFFCGLRRTEALTLQAHMFNINEWEEDQKQMGVLTVVGKGNKQGRIPVKVKVMQEVYNYLPDNFQDETRLFNVNEKRWERVLKKIGKEVLHKHIKPHTLRHSIAMHLRGQDFAIDEIKEFLRHEDISTTQIYSRVTPQQLREKFKSL